MVPMPMAQYKPLWGYFDPFTRECIIAILHWDFAMRLTTLRSVLLYLLALPLLINPATADEAIVGGLSPLDKQYLAGQVTRIDELTRTQLGLRIQGTPADLATLQRLLDLNIVSAGDDLELQAMGIILGNVLVAEYAVKWVSYEDQLGRSRALQIGSTSEMVFPVTMISRRVRAGAKADVAALYDKAANTIARELARPRI